MAFVKLYRKKLKPNYDFLDNLMKKEGLDWGVVTKVLCGEKKYIQELINLGVREMHDTRISNLKVIKQLDPSVQTVYIKPPAKRSIKNVIKYADVSFNTEGRTIELLSREAQHQNKTHKIIIMIELGDLREGVMGENLIDFYSKVFKLPNIEIIGIGANLNCLYGVLPTQDKLIQLSLYKQLIEARFSKKIPWISGGTSVTLPLTNKKQLPKGVNHFRIGETLFFGNNLITEKPFRGMKQGVFRLFTEIIELTEKPKVPIGEFGYNVAGESYEVDEKDLGKKSYRAILDIGLLDIIPESLTPVNKGIEIARASSDMLVVDLGTSKRNYKVGDLVAFDVDYMGLLRLLSSSYVGKIVE